MLMYDERLFAALCIAAAVFVSSSSSLAVCGLFTLYVVVMCAKQLLSGMIAAVLTV